MTDEEFDAIQHNNRDDTYGPGFFKFVEVDHAWANELFGHILYLLFRPKSAIEFGCGTGGTLHGLKQHGVSVLGLDGSADCRPFIARRDAGIAEQVVIHDLTDPWEAPKQYDLVISIETFEHVPVKGADNLVRTVAGAGNLAVITACPPVGRNFLHLNEQPFEYWVEKLAENGMQFDKIASNAVRSAMRAFHTMEACSYPVVPCWFFSSYIGVFTK